MNQRPLYENLDTSFVNLSALVRYLRPREFVGRIKIELNNYQAEIVLLEGNKISVREKRFCLWEKRRIKRIVTTN